MGPTFARGRRDARAGHVRGLTVTSSLAGAQVRGPDDPVAYRARIAVRAFGAAEWSRIEAVLVAQAGYAAALLDGRMPAAVDTVLARAGLSLLPLSLDEVAMDCTCGRAMPCEHVAAACYALAALFDTDPFEAFAWRGLPRDEVLLRLRRLRAAAAVDAVSAAAQPGDAGLGDVADFWDGGATPRTRPYPVAAPVRADALLDQVDPPPDAAGGPALIELLRPAYRALAGPDVVDG
jgi:uncharacterized Zn finger protein